MTRTLDPERRRLHRAQRRARVLLWCGLVPLAVACSQGGEKFDDQPSEPQPGGGEEGVRFSVRQDAEPIVVVRYQRDALEILLANTDPGEGMVGGDLLLEAFAGPAGVARFADVAGGGRVFVVRGALPLTEGRSFDQECTFDPFASIDQRGKVLISIGPGLCGMEHSQLAVEFGAEGVEIADRRFIDDPQPLAAPGTVAIDRPAARGFAVDESVDVALAPVPEDQIEPRSYEPDWPPLRPFVCFDVTVHAGSGGPDGNVVPEVTVSDGGDPVPIPEPTDQIEPRVIAQDPGSAVVWSFGPIDMAEHQPDEITVTATEGEITSWDVSARHC